MLLKEPPWRARGWTVRLIIMSSSLFALSIAGCKDTPTPPAAKKPHPLSPRLSLSFHRIQGCQRPRSRTEYRYESGYIESSRGEQSRSAWSRRLILDERFEKHMCKADGYLLNCVGEFRNPDTRVTDLSQSVIAIRLCETLWVRNLAADKVSGMSPVRFIVMSCR